MKLRGVHHVNIGCGAQDLAAIEKFYGAVLGLKRGFRPEFPNDGLWLYDGGHPLIHVVVRSAGSCAAHETPKCGFDHVAFAMTGVEEFRVRLTQFGVAFDEQNVPQAGFQIFMRDPVGNKLEFNFPNEEAPQTVASGTLAPMQFPEHARR
jgi:catechol 2,3-dioxygenase-like lactoylglutathione lyase family enzyme